MLLQTHRPEKDVKIEIVNGIDIHRTYENAKHCTSCQTGKKATSTIFYKYVEGLVCARLVYQQVYIARALVWASKSAKSGKLKLIIDTVYDSCDDYYCKTCRKFRDTYDARKEEYLLNFLQTLYKQHTLSEDLRYDDVFYVNIKRNKLTVYPYIDTFKILSPDKTTLSTGIITVQGVNATPDYSYYD